MTRNTRDITRTPIGSGATRDVDTSVTGETLEHVRRTETIADHVDFDSLRRELPSEWTARPDLVQFGTEPLAETVLFQRAIAGPKLVLKPVDPGEPTDEIEVYERSDPRASRRQTMTLGPLSDALRVAVNRIHQLDG